MFRVVTEITKHPSLREFDRGPWLRSLDEAEFWARILVGKGYRVSIERLPARNRLDIYPATGFR